MSERIEILQLGNENWSKIYEIPNFVKITNSTYFSENSGTFYDMVFVERKLEIEEILLLEKVTSAYTLYVIKGLDADEEMEEYFARKRAKWIEKAELAEFLKTETKNYFPKPYGEKFKLSDIAIAQGFLGSVFWNGNYSLVLNGDYGTELNQIAYWRSGIPIFEEQAIDFWLEYKKDLEIEIALKITLFKRGSIAQIEQEYFFTEKELQDIVTIDNQGKAVQAYISIFAKGNGQLEIIALHDRHSRRGHGMFLPGGERYVTSDREEIFYYFEPGDLKPPLNVYFSGYKTLQGFEGFYMMRKMGCPFLLIAEPRLEGGCFYMGSDEYEKALADIIRKYMDELGFSREQVILSGLSMGTYGALYYGCDIMPHAMILGKPLANIGDVALNERLNRPGGFPTSLDVLHYLEGDLSMKSVERLNNRFWNKFDKADWSKSKFIISYMYEDDYDKKAYDMLISHLKSGGVQLYGKGIHGRHNDATSSIVSWFKSQYQEILEKDFSREEKEL